LKRIKTRDNKERNHSKMVAFLFAFVEDYFSKIVPLRKELELGKTFIST
jgi:hypothetical protein